MACLIIEESSDDGQIRPKYIIDAHSMQEVNNILEINGYTRMAGANYYIDRNSPRNKLFVKTCFEFPHGKDPSSEIEITDGFKKYRAAENAAIEKYISIASNASSNWYICCGMAIYTTSAENANIIDLIHAYGINDETDKESVQKIIEKFRIRASHYNEVTGVPILSSRGHYTKPAAKSCSGK